MPSIAIVIAVSDYGGPPSDLSACTQDGKALKEILEASNRFDSVLFIGENTTGTAVKTRLADFIKTFHNQTVDEVLFYFTGHGEFSSGANEFYYLLSDYNPRHRRTTSLENAEVDDLIRPLNPQLFAKIVDACNSGKTYIKNRDDIDEYLKSANSKFKNLYFLFSSQADQYSSASDKISYFTESILKSVHSHTAETVRYKDVISYVSDDFSANRAQTPLFVTQADFTETFLPVNAEIRSIIERYINTGAQDDEPEEAKQVEREEEVPSLKLADKIRENAKIFCSRDEAVDILTKLPPRLDRDFLSEDVAGLFSREVQTLETKPFADDQIGRWIDQNKDMSSYFATPTKSEEKYKKRISHPILGISAVLRGDASGDTYVDATRTVVDGYRLTTDMPYTYFVMRLKSQLPNVDMEACFVAPIISRTRIRLFWAYTHYKYADWDNQVLASAIEWNTDDAPLKDEAKIEALAAKILDGFKEFVEEPLRAAWEG